jgi:hypothetical protein
VQSSKEKAARSNAAHRYRKWGSNTIRQR